MSERPLLNSYAFLMLCLHSLKMFAPTYRQTPLSSGGFAKISILRMMCCDVEGSPTRQEAPHSHCMGTEALGDRQLGQGSCPRQYDRCAQAPQEQRSSTALPGDISATATSDPTCTVQSCADRRAEQWSQRWQRDKNQIEARDP